MNRCLVFLILLFALPSAAYAQSLPIEAVTVTVISGQQSVGLRTDAQGRLSVNMDGTWKDVAVIDASGTLTANSNSPGLALDDQGFFVGDGDTTPLSLDDNATVSMSGLEVFRIQTGNLVQIEPIAQALGRDIDSVRVEGPPGTDKLAAYLIVVYILML